MQSATAGAGTGRSSACSVGAGEFPSTCLAGWLSTVQVLRVGVAHSAVTGGPAHLGASKPSPSVARLNCREGAKQQKQQKAIAAAGGQPIASSSSNTMERAHHLAGHSHQPFAHAPYRTSAETSSACACRRRPPWSAPPSARARCRTGWASAPSAGRRSGLRRPRPARPARGRLQRRQMVGKDQQRNGKHSSRGRQVHCRLPAKQQRG